MLGARLKKLRGKKTQQEIADKLGISRARYAHYENEHVQPDNEMLQKIADLHNCTVDYLLGRSNEPFEYGDLVSDEKTKEFIEIYKSLTVNEQRVVYDVVKQFKKKGDA